MPRRPHDVPAPRLQIEIPHMRAQPTRQVEPHIELLVEIAIVQIPVPGYRQRIAAHQSRNGRRIEGLHDPVHILLHKTLIRQPFQVTRHRHIVERNQAIERDPVIPRQRLLPFPFERLLAGRKKRPDRIRHQRQPPVRIPLAVSHFAFSFRIAAMLLGIGPLSPLGIRARLPVMRQRTYDFHPPLGHPLRQIGKAARHQNGQVTPVDDMLSSPDALIHQIPEMRIQFRRAARQIDRVGAGQVNGPETGVHRLPVHVLLRSVRPRIDMAMPAGHVAQFAHIDLENVQLHRRQTPPPRNRQILVEIPRFRRACVDFDRVQHAQLLFRPGKSFAPVPETGGNPRSFEVERAAVPSGKLLQRDEFSGYFHMRSTVPQNEWTSGK